MMAMVIPLSLSRRVSASSDFQQELKDFDVALCSGDVAAPGVKPVPPEQKTVRPRMLVQCRFNLCRKRLHVLRVLDYREPLAVFMSRHAVESLQHLVSFNTESAVARMRVGENIAPNSMGVQYSAGSSKPDDREVQKCFSRSATRSEERRV